MSLTVAQAADVWKKSKEEIDRIKPQMDVAAEVLKEYFRKNDKRSYKGIGYSIGSRNQLDSTKVKTELADRLPKFMRKVTYEVLSLLK